MAGLWNNDPDQSPEFGDDPTVEFPTAATVGYRNAPGYPGFLTPYTGDNIIRETQRFEFMDFIGATIVAPNCEFYGCRFRSNWTDGWNIKVDVDVPLAATFQFFLHHRAVLGDHSQSGMAIGWHRHQRHRRLE